MMSPKNTKIVIGIALSCTWCALAFLIFTPPAMEREVSNYQGEGTIRYTKFTFLPLFTNHGFVLDLPQFELSKPLTKTYALKGIPVSKPLYIDLMLPPSESNLYAEKDAKISIRILAPDGTVVFEDNNHLSDMWLTNHGMPGAKWNAGFANIRHVSLKKNVTYRLEMTYQPMTSAFTDGEANLQLGVSVHP
jgi:hypothetical protein